MSDRAPAERAALNLRGPLLAAAIFAAVFGVLLLMARQNRSNTTDEGSSFREDPYGASLLFDAYARAGYRVERSQDENSLADQDAPRTTAFFIGGYPYDDLEMQDGKLRSGKFRKHLENFLARGGRVVLIDPGLALKSRSQGWEVQDQWPKHPQKARPSWIAPDGGALPAGSEHMYLRGNAPWLETDAHWTALYAGPTEAPEGLGGSTTAGAPPAHVYMAMRRVGKGELIAASQESFLLNETIKTHPNPVLLDFLAGERPVLWVDETLHGLHQDEGVLWLVQRYRLQAALLLFWATLLALLWSMSGGLARRPARQWNTEVTRQGESAGVAAQRLLQRSIPRENVAAECWELFRRRSPQDARAISSDARWGERLRAALAQAPLAGYQELARLVAERRASAKGLLRPEYEEPHEYSASPKTTSEEVRIV